MAGARRRWLVALLALLAVVLLGAAWYTTQAERGLDARETAVSSAPEPTQGGGGVAPAPSNVLGAPIAVPETDPDDGLDGSPIAPWWRRVPPVAGELVPLNGSASGHVRITTNGDHLLITIADLRVASGHPVSSVRVLLSEGDVVGRPVAYWSAHEEDDKDLGVVPADVGTITFDLQSPRGLPEEVRSLVVIDADADDVLGGAALLPTD
ncbi:hypothetical protein ACRQ4B_08710 [Curtobacterium sp. SP.BCo]|uniref:hypothetical protein n=1 Tax=Curtobacterium sp. SP.BCo TaxID=3435229 RepID=UPI003F7411FA